MGDAPRLTDEELDDILGVCVAEEEMDYETVLSALVELRDRRAQSEGAQAKVVEALRQIAHQVLPEDMSVDQQLDADFEGACEIMIKLARAALTPIGDSSGEGGWR